MTLRLSIDDIAAGLAYARWLHMKCFNDAMNQSRGDLPKLQTPVCLNTVGKGVYERALREVRADTASKGIVLLGEGERKAVVQYLAELKDSGRGAATTKRSSLKVGSIQKFVSSGDRKIRGVASSSRPDRMGDIVEPKGGIWSLPVPLLWMHNHREPVGWVRAIDVGTSELRIEAEFATGVGRADEIWAMVDKGLVDSFSIGFRSLQSEPLPTGGLRFTKWELLEVSCVSIPANADAKIGKRADTGITLQPGRRAGAVKLQPSSQDGAVKLHQRGVRLITPGVKLGGR